MTVIDQIRMLKIYPYALHITSISNLVGICSENGIRPRNQMANNSFIDISDPSVQNIRAQKKIPGVGSPLHNYIPFFLTFKSPMVAMRQKQNEDLVYIQISLDIFTRINGCFLTDGNATNGSTIFEPLTTVDAFKILDLSVLYKVKYRNDKEKARRKSAELLVPDFVPQNEIKALIFYNDAGKDKGLANIQNSGIKPAIYVWPKYFFGPEPIG